MKFGEALEHININRGMITRDNWRYVLYFNEDGYLIIDDSNGQLSPYSPSVYDFMYDWKLKE